MWRAFPTLAAPAAIVLVAAMSARCAAPTDNPAGSPVPPPINAVATVDDIMDAMIVPASQAIFDAVVYSNGELIAAPTSDNDWVRLRMSALSVAEAGNLLMLPPRARDSGDWMAMARAMNDRAIVVAHAAEAQDVDALMNTAGEMYTTCSDCHAKYIVAP